MTRFVVTRYHEDEVNAGCEPKGEFSNGEVAYQVAYALAKEEHQRLGFPPGDMRIIYPEIPEGVSVPPQGTYIQN